MSSRGLGLVGSLDESLKGTQGHAGLLGRLSPGHTARLQQRQHAGYVGLFLGVEFCRAIECRV